jgi:hypothetical protein
MEIKLHKEPLICKIVYKIVKLSEFVNSNYKSGKIRKRGRKI